MMQSNAWDQSSERVELLRWTPIEAAILGARTCKDTVAQMDTVGDTLGPRDAELLRRLLAMDPPHKSVVEHVGYQFRLTLSRGCLQEERRTRMSSPSVKSSRFTLGKQIRREADLTACLHQTGDAEVDALIAGHMENMVALARRRSDAGQAIPNDVLKYALTDAFLTVEVVTLNADALRNVFRTRLGKGVLPEYRSLAWGMWRALPASHRVMFEDVVAHVIARDVLAEGVATCQEVG
jgi:thymidylate synthase (FAD)